MLVFDLPFDPRRIAFAREVHGVLWGSKPQNLSISGVAHLTRDVAMCSLVAAHYASCHRGRLRGPERAT
jgi:hypothetical protein